MWGCPSDNNADFAWLQHMIKSMDPKNGRCAVVLPQGVLFHTGQDKRIREQLVRSDKLEAVITLASGVFYSTTVSACILLLNNNKTHKHKGRICMIDATEIFTLQRAQNVITVSDAKTIYNLYAEYADVVEKCKVVSLADVEKKDFDLSVKKYIEMEEIQSVAPQEVRKRYFSAIDRVSKAEDTMQRILTEGGFIHE